jgi:ribosomal protein S18 acetylase RimI-like enzyme
MIKIRVAKVEDLALIARIRIDNWRITYKGLLPQSFLDDLDYEKETQSWLTFSQAERHHVFVAIDENESIMGFVGIRPFDREMTIGEIHALHTSEEFRGKGAGKALIYHSAKLFKSQNIKEMRLWVIEGNDNATAIYEHLGAETYIERVDIINSTDVPEIGMKWNDLNLILNK